MYDHTCDCVSQCRKIATMTRKEKKDIYECMGVSEFRIGVRVKGQGTTVRGSCETELMAHVNDIDGSFWCTFSSFEGSKSFKNLTT